MDVYDSNVWIWGLTEEASEPTDLVEQVIDGDRYVGVSAYIHGEVTAAFRRSRTAGDDAIRQAQKTFNTVVAKRHNVDFPDHDEIREMNIHQFRKRPTVRTFAHSLGIQPKDVPILVFASEYENDTTVFTTDRPFSELVPSDNGLSGVEIEHIPTS